MNVKSIVNGTKDLLRNILEKLIQILLFSDGILLG